MSGETDEKLESSTSSAEGGGEQPQANNTPESPSQSSPNVATHPASGAEAPEPTDNKPRDERGRFAPKSEAEATPDPVEAAIDRLGRPKAPEKTQTPAQPPAKPTQPAQEPPKATSEQPKQAPPGSQQPPKDDPFEGLPPEALKAETRKRIETLHRQRVDAEAKLAEFQSNPVASDFTQAVKDFGLEPDLGFVPAENLASLVKVQAAINRAHLAIQQGRRPASTDLQAVAQLHAQVDQLATGFGAVRPPAKPAPPSVPLAPMQGQLPQEYQDLIEVYGQSEERVRLLAAIEAQAKGKPAASPPTPAPQVPPVVEQPPQRQPVAEGVDMDALYAQRLAGDLIREGVAANQLKAHVTALQPFIVKETQQRFPFVEASRIPQVFDQLDAKERYEIMLSANRVARGNVSSPRSTSPPPPTRALHSGAPMRRTALAADDGDPVLAAMNRLSRAEE